ncbi:hypothetical protein [Pilimelia columellifera]|uniref:Uncharacterized protein n=1 Tax=Pilimelia columellifera subsp. columellifera TaxID=706583 RepID=A0ABN3N901_9ACTN
MERRRKKHDADVPPEPHWAELMEKLVLDREYERGHRTRLKAEEPTGIAFETTVAGRAGLMGEETLVRLQR